MQTPSPLNALGPISECASECRELLAWGKEGYFQPVSRPSSPTQLTGSRSKICARIVSLRRCSNHRHIHFPRCPLPRIFLWFWKEGGNSSVYTHYYTLHSSCVCGSDSVLIKISAPYLLHFEWLWAALLQEGTKRRPSLLQDDKERLFSLKAKDQSRLSDPQQIIATPEFREEMTSIMTL